MIPPVLVAIVAARRTDAGWLLYRIVGAAAHRAHARPRPADACGSARAAGPRTIGATPAAPMRRAAPSRTARRRRHGSRRAPSAWPRSGPAATSVGRASSPLTATRSRGSSGPPTVWAEESDDGWVGRRRRRGRPAALPEWPPCRGGRGAWRSAPATARGRSRSDRVAAPWSGRASHAAGASRVATAASAGDGRPTRQADGHHRPAA